MPRTPWGRRRSADSPRPAGRRWAGRLRRGGSLARQVLFVRVGRRRASGAGPVLLTSEPTIEGGESGHVTRAGHPGRRFLRRRYRADLDPRVVAPVSPAMPTVPELVGAVPAGGMAIPLLPGVPTPARRLRFAAVNACTVSSLLLGLSAIFLSMQDDVRTAAACLLACVVFDGLDGALARRLGVASPFGAQMDSLADMCSFGVAAPVVVYASIHHTTPTLLAAGACAVVGACAAIRLARFNVSPKDGRFFCGVPTTMIAGVLGLAALIGVRLPGAVAVTVLTLLGLAMVTSFPYAKLARIAKLPPWLWLAPVIGGLLDYRITFAALVGAYVMSGPLLWLRQRQRA